jgi:hypothetical protein
VNSSNGKGTTPARTVTILGLDERQKTRKKALRWDEVVQGGTGRVPYVEVLRDWGCSVQMR